MRRYKNWFPVSCVVALIVCLASCGPPTAEPTKVTMMLDWVPNTNHTGLYVAKHKGWYADEGLEVDIVEPSAEGTIPVQLVAAGKADFGISYQEEVTHARAEDISVVSIAAIIQHNTSGFASLEEKGITRPRDFEGKTYGAFGSPMELPMLKAMVECDGGNVDTVQFIQKGWDPFLAALGRGIDFVWIFYGWEGIEAEIKEVPLNVVMMTDWECVPDYYTPVIIASEEAIADRPEVIRRFMAATAKGYEYAIAHPQEAADILLEYAPETDAELARQSQEWLSPRYQAEATQWGEQKLEVWQRYVEWMHERGLIPKAINPEKAFANQFLPQR